MKKQFMLSTAAALVVSLSACGGGGGGGSTTAAAPTNQPILVNPTNPSIPTTPSNPTQGNQGGSTQSTSIWKFNNRTYTRVSSLSQEDAHTMAATTGTFGLHDAIVARAHSSTNISSCTQIFDCSHIAVMVQRMPGTPVTGEFDAKFNQLTIVAHTTTNTFTDTTMVTTSADYKPSTYAGYTVTSGKLRVRKDAKGIYYMDSLGSLTLKRSAKFGDLDPGGSAGPDETTLVLQNYH